MLEHIFGLYISFGATCLLVTLIGWLSEEDPEKNDNTVVFGILATIFNPLIALVLIVVVIYVCLMFFKGIFDAFVRVGLRLQKQIGEKLK